MLPVRFDEIGSANILRLIQEKISERKTLEYKAKLNISNQEDTAEFLADISSFANAAGGDIIFGISDERDENGKATGIPDAIQPLTIANEDAERGRISNIIESGIQPRIPGIQVKVVAIPEKGPVIVVRIPRSWVAPHMVSYANRTRFFSRDDIHGKRQLDVQQIGAAFAEQRGLGERLRAWRSDRIGKAVAGEGPVSLEGAVMLFHFISAPGLRDGGDFLRARVFDTQNLMRGRRLLYAGAHLNRYNADGLLGCTLPSQQGQSYLQIFRDGSLEYGDSARLNTSEEARQATGQPVIASAVVEQNIIDVFADALNLLHQLETPEPVYVSLSLVGVKGKVMALPDMRQHMGYRAEPFDRAVILSPDVPIEDLSEGPPYPSTLLPIIDAIWQAAGSDGTPYKDRFWQTRRR